MRASADAVEDAAVVRKELDSSFSEVSVVEGEDASRVWRYVQRFRRRQDGAWSGHARLVVSTRDRALYTPTLGSWLSRFTPASRCAPSLYRHKPISPARNT